MNKPLFLDDLNAVIRQHSEVLTTQLHGQRENLFPPDASKQMRRFISGEAATLLAVNDGIAHLIQRTWGRDPSWGTSA